MQTLPARGVDVRMEGMAIEPQVERANEPVFTHLTAWSMVCALQKYIFCYADFRRLQRGALVLSRKNDGEIS